MQSQNAFIGRIDQPQPEEVDAVLGKSAAAWHRLVQWLMEKESVTKQEWTSFSAKYGWSLKMKKKKRTIIYLGPSMGSFTAGLVLGPRAMTAARGGDLSAETLKILDDAPRYPEGTGVRIQVKNSKGLGPIRSLVKIKLAY